MKKALFRTRQFLFSVFVGMAQKKETKLIRGENSILKLPDLLLKENHKNILVVTTEGFIKRKTLEPLFASLEKNNIKFSVYTGVHPDPSVADVEGGVLQYKSNNANAIVAIGGGSVLDCAKIIGARVNNPNKSVRDMRGLLKVTKGMGAYYPVPATCGTGSEATAAAVITDEIDGKHYKYAVTDLKIIPDTAILDPAMLKTLPASMVATTAMDALTHSIEAYTNLFASEAVVKDAKESVKLIFENLEIAYKDKDMEALDKLLYASTLGGIAITHNYVGYVHALAHAMGAIYGLPHGYLNAIILPLVLKRFEPSIEKKMKDLCDYCGINADDHFTDAIVSRLKELKAMAGLPDTIAQLKEEDFDEIVARADLEANPTYPVPMIFSKEELREMLVALSN